MARRHRGYAHTQRGADTWAWRLHGTNYASVINLASLLLLLVHLVAGPLVRTVCLRDWCCVIDSSRFTALQAMEVTGVVLTTTAPRAFEVGVLLFAAAVAVFARLIVVDRCRSS